MAESDLNASAETGAGKPKKTTKRAPRAASADAPKKTRVTKPKSPKASAKSESVREPSLFEPTSSPAPEPYRAPEPVREAVAAPVHFDAPAPAPTPPAERPVFVPSSERAAAAASDAQQNSFESSGATSAEPQSQDSAPSADRGHEGSAPQGGFQQGQGGVGGAPEDDRGPWWKRKKDKKNKWKDKHQNSGGGGGGRSGGHPQHPPQPAPPVLAPQHYGDLPDPARFEDQVALDTLAASLLTGNGAAPIQIDQLFSFSLFELTAYARKLDVPFEGTLNRLQMLEAIFIHAAEKQIPIVDRGLVELTDKGHGFIVHEQANYRLYPESTYLPESLIKRYVLKRGHHVEVIVQSPQSGDRCAAVVGVKTVMGKAPDEVSRLTPFEELVPYYPLQRILLEAPEIHKDISMRAVDLLTPIGFGQRGLLVAPPRTGKTVLLQNIANSISHNFPDKKLILLLIDERPEEVTDFKRHTKGEVVSSTFDEAPESHVHAAEMVIEKSRRLVEQGEHVVILLDSITRLARAYNALAANSGKIMSGGVEATALQKPKRFFGSARNIEGGGSITIIGTALIDTGSRMDEVIFEEFKGTGNMELHLDRGLSDKRIFPAINIDRSGTRKEELIYHPEEMLRVYGLRRAMQGIPPVEAMDMLIQRLKKTKTNAEFLMSLSR
ncbi:transcription termination factor Rho [Rariglobus hedericola]|uniref:Transcription termination factor Rho n=1 Tax=Rariglobus hedericola TaxID=2597822 RepID=A0A556QMU3_9BACT|nr:transcription termination factor Rho [Rariglobus hedericola]TSJ77970.1 transcription termination factor Rho [Rariglobus hedericola]